MILLMIKGILSLKLSDLICKLLHLFLFLNYLLIIIKKKKIQY